MTALTSDTQGLEVKPACTKLGLSRATVYRRLNPPAEFHGPPKPRPKPPRALSEEEQDQVLELLHSDRFIDLAPAQVVAQLLEEEQYLCSERTMYRILNQHGEVKERRAQRRHPNYACPKLVATAPNQVWTWDVTKIKGPVKGQLYSLYVIIDLYSRYVVGWCLSRRATAEVSKHLLSETLKKYDLNPEELTIHSDRGPEFIGAPLTELLDRLDLTQSKSRPRVSNDNAFSESKFKTLKYHPTFPDNFGSFENGLSFLRPYFGWYNNEHRHSGIAYLTPAAVHFGFYEEVLERKQRALDAAYEAHPERWVNGKPKAKRPPQEVWINEPEDKDKKLSKLSELVSQSA